MLKKLIILIIIVSVAFYLYKSKQNNSKVLGIATVKTISHNVPEPIQDFTSSALDTSKKTVQKTTSNITKTVTSAIQCSLFKQALPHLNTLNAAQKKEIEKAVCK